MSLSLSGNGIAEGRMNGRKKAKEISSRTKETKFESRETRVPLMMTKENPQTTETSSRRWDPLPTAKLPTLRLFALLLFGELALIGRGLRNSVGWE